MILQIFISPRHYSRQILDTWHLQKISLRKIMKISPSEKINPSEMWQNMLPQKLISLG